MLVLSLLLVACDLGAPKTAADCLPTLGDHCDCDHKCMTQAEIDRATQDGVCDLGCDTGSESLGWTCDLVDGACVVVE